MVRIHHTDPNLCGCSSVGRVPACQAGRHGFEPRYPLQFCVVTNNSPRVGLHWKARLELTDLAQSAGGKCSVATHRIKVEVAQW